MVWKGKEFRMKWSKHRAEAVVARLAVNIREVSPLLKHKKGLACATGGVVGGN